MIDYIQVTTTVEKQEDAEKLARLILERRLAGCIQISPCNSMYHWQGAIEQENEFKLVMKSQQHLYPLLEKLILANHPYDIPEIVASAVLFSSKGYGEWMDGELEKE